MPSPPNASSDTAPDVLDARPDERTAQLGWRSPDGRAQESAVVILVSNNAYRLGRVVGSGTRSRMDAGELGLAVLQTPEARRPGRLWQQWSAPTFEVTASEPVPVGVDGEALVLAPRFGSSAGRGRCGCASRRNTRVLHHRPGSPRELSTRFDGCSQWPPDRTEGRRQPCRLDGRGLSSSSLDRAGPSVGGARSSRWCFSSRS